MARSATGQIIHNANGCSARIRIGPGPADRPSFSLAVTDDAAAEQRTAVLATIAKAPATARGAR